MNVRQLITDDSAVSPVVGVILMVAITVLLAATAASFFLGLTGNTSETPQVAIKFDYNSENNHENDQLKMSHAGGDTVDASNLVISVSDIATPTPANGGAGVFSRRVGWNKLKSGSSVTKVAAGMSVTVSKDTLNSEVSNDISNEPFSLKQASAAVVWNDPDNSKSFTLADWTAPTAE